MPFTAIVAAAVSVAAARAQPDTPWVLKSARTQQNPPLDGPLVGRYVVSIVPGRSTQARPDATADLFRHEPTAKVMKDLRADAWSEQNTALVAKCVTALLVVVAVWIGVVLWSSSKSPEPVPSVQPEQSN